MSQGQGNKTVEGKKSTSPTPSELLEELRAFDPYRETPLLDTDATMEPGSTTADHLRATAARRSRLPPPRLERVNGQPVAPPSPVRAEGQPRAQAPGEGKETKITIDVDVETPKPPRASKAAEHDDTCAICLEELKGKVVAGPCGQKRHGLHLSCALDWQRVRQQKGATRIHCPYCREQGPFYGVNRRPDEDGCGILARMDADLSEMTYMPVPLDAKETSKIEPYDFDLAEYQKVLRSYASKQACADARKLHAVKTAKSARKSFNAQMAAVTRYRKGLSHQAYLNMAYRMYDEEQLYTPAPEARPTRSNNNSSSSSSSSTEANTMDEFDEAFD